VRGGAASAAPVLVSGLGLGGELTKVLAEQVDGVDRLAITLEFVLPQPSLDVDEIAFTAMFLDVAAGTRVEDRDLVEVGVVLPDAVLVLPAVVRGDRNLCDVVEWG
jgi:hypothetical protein